MKTNPPTQFSEIYSPPNYYPITQKVTRTCETVFSQSRKGYLSNLPCWHWHMLANSTWHWVPLKVVYMQITVQYFLITVNVHTLRWFLKQQSMYGCAPSVMMLISRNKIRSRKKNSCPSICLQTSARKTWSASLRSSKPTRYQQRRHRH